MIKAHITLILKGMAMGAANVIPGVSGGTIALITGIFERLINAIKNINLTAVRLLFKGEFRLFAQHIDLTFSWFWFFWESPQPLYLWPNYSNFCFLIIRFLSGLFSLDWFWHPYGLSEKR
jgi:uncharacterized membrane protein